MNHLAFAAIVCTMILATAFSDLDWLRLGIILFFALLCAFSIHPVPPRR